MKPLAELLREGDPLIEDDGLSEAEALAMRRRITGEAVGCGMSSGAWRPALAVAAALAVVITVGITTARRVPAPAPSPGSTGEAGTSGERRQLQFATPGGTRIIWTFDPEFSLKDTNP